jgi:hypothetical protein
MGGGKNAGPTTDDWFAPYPSGSCVGFVLFQVAGWLASVILIAAVNGSGSATFVGRLLAVMVCGIFFAKLTLGALATVLGPWSPLARLTVPPLWFLGEFILAFVVWEQKAPNPEGLLAGGLMALFWLGLQIPMWPVRLWTRSRLCPLDDVPTGSVNSQEQFSIAQILGFTLVVAVVLGGGKALIPADVFRQFFAFLPGELFAGAVIVLTGAINGMIVCRFALDEEATTQGLIGVVCYTGLLCGMSYIALAASLKAVEAASWSGMIVGQTAWLLLSLGVLRSAGWRLVSAKEG